MNLSFKLANNSKLTRNKHKKWLKNNLYFYYSTEDHKLDSCPKKQTIATFKDCSALVSTSEKPLENRRQPLGPHID